MIRVWRVDSGVLVGQLKAHSERVDALALSQDGKTVGFEVGRDAQLVSAASDKTLLVWDVEKEYELRKKCVANDTCLSLLVTSSNVIGGYSSGSVRIWSL